MVMVVRVIVLELIRLEVFLLDLCVSTQTDEIFEESFWPQNTAKAVEGKDPATTSSSTTTASYRPS